MIKFCWFEVKDQGRKWPCTFFCHSFDFICILSTAIMSVRMWVGECGCVISVEFILSLAMVWFGLYCTVLHFFLVCVCACFYFPYIFEKNEEIKVKGITKIL